METEQWYLYLDGDREGPFTSDELRAHAAAGRLRPDDFLWREGMTRWERASATRALEPAPAKPARAAPRVAPSPAPFLTRRRRALLSRAGIAFAILAIGAAGFVAARREVLRAREEAARAAAIPALEGLGAEEAKELLAAAAAPVEAGARAALVLSRADPWSPSFWVATNFRGPLEVVVAAKPRTLLGRTHFTARATVAPSDGWARVGPFREAEGLPLPRGEYQVTVLAASRALARKSYFLGGNWTMEYARDLATFHDQLREQGQLELAELGELARTLDAQLRDTLADFERGARWSSSSRRWNAIQKPLDGAAREWAKEKALARPRLYALAGAALAELERLHEAQGRALDQFERAPASEPGRSALAAQDALAAFKRALSEGASQGWEEGEADGDAGGVPEGNEAGGDAGARAAPEGTGAFASGLGAVSAGPSSGR